MPHPLFFRRAYTFTVRGWRVCHLTKKNNMELSRERVWTTQLVD